MARANTAKAATTVAMRVDVRMPGSGSSECLGPCLARSKTSSLGPCLSRSPSFLRHRSVIRRPHRGATPAGDGRASGAPSLPRSTCPSAAPPDARACRLGSGDRPRRAAPASGPSARGEGRAGRSGSGPRSPSPAPRPTPSRSVRARRSRPGPRHGGGMQPGRSPPSRPPSRARRPRPPSRRPRHGGRPSRRRRPARAWRPTFARSRRSREPHSLRHPFRAQNRVKGERVLKTGPEFVPRPTDGSSRLGRYARTMFGTSSRFQVAKIRGIPIYASWSWLAIAAFFMFGWYTQFSTQMTSNEAVRLAVITGVLFFGGILLHEAAHAIAARSFDLPVRAITLVFWGGATETRSWRAGPLADFVVAAAGPGTTAVLGLGFLYISSIMTPGDTSEAIRSLGGLNLYFAVLNSVPGFPLDGGRMLMAAAWGATKNRGTALKVAGFGSMIVGIGLIGYAVLSFSQGNGGFGIFLGYLGFVLLTVGRQVPARATLHQQLSRGKVRDAMRPLGAAIPANVTVYDATERWLRAEPARTFSVVEDGPPVGTISLEC